jgi:uncharacterized membrane protein YeaQ/YmgE (transglycosylase-associated protein family)
MPAGMLLNIVVGIVGAMVVMVDLATGRRRNHQSIQFQPGALIVSLIGAVILLAIVNLFRRGRVRQA